MPAGPHVRPGITILTTNPTPIYTQASLSTHLALSAIEPQLLRAAERPPQRRLRAGGAASLRRERGTSYLRGRGGTGTWRGAQPRGRDTESPELRAARRGRAERRRRGARAGAGGSGGRRGAAPRRQAEAAGGGGPLYPACPAPEGERPFPANSVQRRGRGEAPSGEAHRPTKLFQNHPCVTRGRAPRRPMGRCGAIFGANGRVGEAGASWSSGSAGS